ncbi:MAG: TIGR04283 family arsenosugar biosynthesis glycosyltransferase [Methylophaga sp.]
MNSLLAIIVPVLNESETLPVLLNQLRPFHERGAEIIIVDGGSEDNSAMLVLDTPYRLLVSSRGRASQMNTGARASSADNLLFLHADTQLPAMADVLSISALLTHHWGRFDVNITGRSHFLSVVAFMMNWRSRLTGIATGDQAIFMRRSTYEAAGGFPEQGLMEDIEMSRILKRLGQPACLREKVSTSGRRWEKSGVWRTILLMWRLRFAYWLGANPDSLAERYR